MCAASRAARRCRTRRPGGSSSIRKAHCSCGSVSRVGPARWHTAHRAVATVSPRGLGRGAGRKCGVRLLRPLLVLMACAAQLFAAPRMQPSTRLSFGPDTLVLEYEAPHMEGVRHALFVALDSEPNG